MPPFRSTIRRAVLPTLAAAACLPASAAAQTPGAGGSSTPSQPAPVAGGAAIADAPVPTTAGGAEAEPEGKLVHVLERDLSLSAKSRVRITVRALDHPVRVELRVGSQGRKVADAELAPGERRELHGGALRGEALRLLVRRTDGGADTGDVAIGGVRRPAKLRPTTASWYGPGLFGNRTACGQTLTRGLRGVAHKSLPCGTALTVKFKGRSTNVRVVDRGPFHRGREFDLTYATASAIGFKAVGRVWVSR